MKKVGGKKVGDFVACERMDLWPAMAHAVQGTIGSVKIWRQLNKIVNSPKCKPPPNTPAIRYLTATEDNVTTIKSNYYFCGKDISILRTSTWRSSINLHRVGVCTCERSREREKVESE